MYVVKLGMITGSLKRYLLIFIIMLISSALSGQQLIGVSNQNSDSRYDELIEYFNDIAIDGYYMERWEQPLYIKVMGDYTQEDYAALTSIVDEIDSLGVMPGISIEKDKSNCIVSFDTLDEMKSQYLNFVNNNYEEGDWWITDLEVGSSGIYSANISIANDVTTQEQRNYMILLSVASLIGLESCSDKYPDSIFYDEWTNAQSLSDMDYDLIRMLYMDSLHTGMHENEADEILMPWVKENIPIRYTYDGDVNIV